MTGTTIAIVGAGFSGTLLALHLLQRAPSGTRVQLIERNSQFGRGPAYATGNPHHLLNVPAGRMSAFHDRPGDFLDWLRQLPPEQRNGIEPEAGTFVPRQLFGAYVRSLLSDELKRREERDRLELVRGDVLRIDRSGDPLVLHLDRDRSIEAQIAVLAVGNFPPEPPRVADPSFYDGPLYRPDPWAANGLADLDRTAPVLLIGTSLTIVDVTVSLLAAGHTGPIHALSRRGLLPHRHGGRPAPSAGAPGPVPTSVTALTRHLREHAARVTAAGGSWHSVVDDMRPFTQDVWQMMPTPDRRRFLRHLRVWWDIHRHRIAAPVGERIDAARASGQLRTYAGHVQHFAPSAGGVDVTYRPRGTDRRETIFAARVINCSGPSADYDRIQDPLIRNLLRDGTVRPDRLRLGLDVTNACALLNREGAISRRLFAVGPVTKGLSWEITAVPDIRRQCEVLAHHLASLVRPAPGNRRPADQRGQFI
jgi:uncharacterized NAD(P)/FAD-binding protein YdhS